MLAKVGMPTTAGTPTAAGTSTAAGMPKDSKDASNS
jgi:hypothetical protein